MKKNLKKYLNIFIKVAVTSAALYFVFRKIDTRELIESLKTVNIFYYILGFLAFNASKIIAAFRLNHLYQAIGIFLKAKVHIRLYYLGMFYNLFLPGAIGGDGYKIYLLKQANEVKTKHLISSSILDRGSGLVYLYILGAIFLFFSSISGEIQYFTWLLIASVSLAIPVFFIIVKTFFKIYLSKFAAINWLSLGVQIGQVICAFFLLKSLGVQSHYLDYLALFMASSVVAVLPISIGGVGLREMVFIYGFQFLEVSEAESIAFTLLFFSVTAFSSLLGLFVSVNIEKNIKGKDVISD